MYNVSQDYIDAMHGAVTRAYITFTVDSVSYTEQNILKGSFNISNQCTGTNDVNVGGVYIGVLNATLSNVNINRQSWRGKKIIPTFHFLVDEENDTWEDVPLGEYSISQAEWKSTGVVVRAYDNMSLLDTPYFISLSSGTLYDYLLLLEDATGIELAQTRAQFEALPNGDVTFSFDNDAGAETWRDIASSIAQIVGGFATCDREGKLLFVSFGQTSVDTIDIDARHTGGMFSDYTTKYTAFSVSFVDTKENITYFQEQNDGLTVSLGANPFLQDRDEVDAISQPLLDALANIQYIPFKASVASNPIYDLGDVVTFIDGIAGTASLCCVQKYEFYLHKNYRMSGYGSDPNAQDAKSKTQKQLAGVQSEIGRMSAQTLDYILPITISQSNIGDGVSSTIETFEFNITDENAKVSFFTCLNFLVETTVSGRVYKDLDTEVTLTLDGSTYAVIPKTYRDGDQVLTLNVLVEGLAKGNHTLAVNFANVGGSTSQMQIVTAYLLAAKVVNSGSVSEKILFANGHWSTGVLVDGLDTNKMTKNAHTQGVEDLYIKYAKPSSPTGATANIEELSQYYLSNYILCNGQYYAEPFYIDDDYFRKDATHGYDISTNGKPISYTNVLFWIPIKRMTGFKTLQVDCKTVAWNGKYWSGAEDFNFVYVSVGAVVDGEMRVRDSQRQSNVQNWVTYSIDISTLPYVDYIVLRGTDGSPAYKNIKLLRS